MKPDFQLFRRIAPMACVFALLALVSTPFVHRIEVLKNSGACGKACCTAPFGGAFALSHSAKIPGKQGHQQHDPATCKICQAFLTSKHFVSFAAVSAPRQWLFRTGFHFVPSLPHIPGIAELTGTSPRAPPSFC